MGPPFGNIEVRARTISSVTYGRPMILRVMRYRR